MTNWLHLALDAFGALVAVGGGALGVHRARRGRRGGAADRRALVEAIGAITARRVALDSLKPDKSAVQLAHAWKLVQVLMRPELLTPAELEGIAADGPGRTGHLP